MNDEIFNKHVTVTEFVHGPFVIVVRSLEDPTDDVYPMVIGPKEGYLTKESALTYVERFRNRGTPYLGMHFTVAQHSSEAAFNVFCSWEE